MEKLIIKKKVITYEFVEKEATLSEYVGYKIKQIRKTKNINQTELAKILGLTRASIVNIEAGRQNITIDKLSKLCRSLDINSNEILPF